MKRTIDKPTKTSTFSQRIRTSQVFYTSLFVAVMLWALFLLGFSRGTYCSEIFCKDSFAVSCKAFTALNIPIKEIKVQAWGQINNEGNKQSLQNIYRQAAAQFMLDDEKLEIKEKTGCILLKQQEMFTEGCFQLTLQSPANSALSPACYYNFLYTTHNTESAREVYQKLGEFLEKLNVQEEVGVTYTGTIPDFIAEEGCCKLAQKAAQAVQAQRIEGINDETLTSLSFYTPQGGKWADVQGRKINLQVALHYDEFQDVTNIYVGIPLIYQDY